MPLRWKLVGLYALILAGVIAAFSAALIVGHRRALIQASDAELETRAKAVCGLADFEDGKWFTEEKSGLEQEYAADRGLYFIVVDSKGAVGLASALARAKGIVPPTADGARDLSFDGRRFRERTLTLTKPPDAETGTPAMTIRVVCGMDMSAFDLSATSLARQLWIIGPIVLLLSLGGGWWLVARALTPIDRIATTAAQIEATELTRRIDVRGSDELARLGRTLNAMFDRLQESFDRQARFTADASHELRTPLSVIAGNVELGLKRPRTAEEHREILQDVREASDRMRSIVEGLLTLARADARSLPMRRERVSLTTTADEIVRLCRGLAAERDVRITVESQGDVAVLGDSDRLKELVSNLVTNSIRYNRPGGSVSVRLSMESGRALLAVDDTGIGIPAADLPHIFERFYRVDKARSREQGGSGLGLAIAKWIVDAHAGEIRVTSRPGEGSSFVVVLPA